MDRDGHIGIALVVYVPMAFVLSCMGVVSVCWWSWSVSL